MTAPAQWWDEDDRTIATALEIIKSWGPADDEDIDDGDEGAAAD
jgi:hypothetical protein